jgi:serine-type D-Ala-D-Ala carboxypeptidase/endopeptidase
VLAAYAGTYDLQGTSLVCTLENGHLVLQAGQSKLQLFAASETKFFSVTPNLQIEFVKDEQGAVTHFVLRQGTNEVKAPRK